MNWNAAAIRALVREGLAEDDVRHDITSQALIPSSLKIHAAIRAKQTGVVCGLPLAKTFFQTFDRRLSFQSRVREGERVSPGQSLAVIRGAARSILSAERPALNALQHLSGIATTTRANVTRLGRGKTKLYDTRKTLPGWRVLQKYAVACGGGTNHRASLGDAILVKENHLKVTRLAGKDWLDAAHRLKKRHVPIEQEIQTERDLRDALCLKPQTVLLDNMPVATLKRMIRVLRKEIPDVKIEISGGVTPDQLRVLGRLGADRISMGQLTHSVQAFDCSLDILAVL